MIKNKTILAIIPARGGSKGLPRKNILPLLGKPLIYWTIKAAKGSKYIDRIVLSTDDIEIANVAKEYDCEVPFIRPKNIANDSASSFDVIDHCYDFFKEKRCNFDYIILLEPTSPLRDSKDIDLAIENLYNLREKADSIVGVSKVEATHPAFDVVINDEGLIVPYQSKKFTILRRQDIEDLYFFEGSIYMSLTKTLLEKKIFYHERTAPHFMPRWKSIEIDELADLIIAEALLNNKSILEMI